MVLVIVLVLLFPVVYFIAERQKNKNTDDNSNKVDAKKKERLDAILKNNKDRYHVD